MVLHNRCEECHDWSDKHCLHVGEYMAKLSVQREKKRERKAKASSSSFSGFFLAMLVPLCQLPSPVGSGVMMTTPLLTVCPVSFSACAPVVSTIPFVPPLEVTPVEPDRKRHRVESPEDSTTTVWNPLKTAPLCLLPFRTFGPPRSIWPSVPLHVWVPRWLRLLLLSLCRPLLSRLLFRQLQLLVLVSSVFPLITQWAVAVLLFVAWLPCSSHAIPVDPGPVWPWVSVLVPVLSSFAR